ncbi:MAG TPA: N-formylglutamate amidohydrolase, partial [Armatimonadota bacterium]|nr:N-formylglutamate amidohydrolase [Armatimonadota bacterium]
MPPASAPLPVVLHVPHASVEIPADVRQTLTISDKELERELLRMTDRYTDELFAVPGATSVLFPVSRLVVDPERFPEDADEPMSRGGMGAVYTRTSDGDALRGDLTVEERAALLERFYHPHHAR